MLRARKTIGAPRIVELLRISQSYLEASLLQQHARPSLHEHRDPLPTLATWYTREMSTTSQQPGCRTRRTRGFGLCTKSGRSSSQGHPRQLQVSQWGAGQVKRTARPPLDY